MWERLLDLQQGNGLTILLTTHDMAEANCLCDQSAMASLLPWLGR